MPKVGIDYSNTIFYKIFCKDSAIKDLYVGLTTNFVQRKHAHKQSCKNEKALNHNCKLYNAIRKAGGWDNWHMEIIAFHNCADSYEARKKEQEYFETLGATLNSIEPFPKPKIKEPPVKIVKEKKTLFCELCNVHFSHLTTQETHNNTKKHHKMMGTHVPNKLEQDTPENFMNKYCCILCNYYTSSHKDYIKHNLTRKHENRTNLTVLEQNVPNKSHLFECECGRTYSARNSLWYHKQKCKLGEPNCLSKIITHTEPSNKHLLTLLIKESIELKNMMIEQTSVLLEVIKKYSVNESTTAT